jgi:hypothetical protein
MITVSPARILQIHDLGYQNNPFVAWSNLGAAATLGGTAVLTGGERANAVTGTTYDKWRPDVTTSEAALSFDFGSTTALKFAAIASHNAHTHGASVAVQTSADNTTWADAGTGAVVAVAGVMAFRFSASARYWRFRFTGLTAGDDLSVGIAFLGNETIFPRRFYQGFAPVLTPTEVELQSNVSVGAHLLGSSVIERGSTLSASVQNIPAAFIRSDEWTSFQTAFGEGKGFFFAWRPAKYPEDIHYCWRDGGVIRPSNTGPRDLMNIEFSARAFNG